LFTFSAGSCAVFSEGWPEQSLLCGS